MIPDKVICIDNKDTTLILNEEYTLFGVKRCICKTCGVITMFDIGIKSNNWSYCCNPKIKVHEADGIRWFDAKRFTTLDQLPSEEIEEVLGKGLFAV